MNFLKCLLQFLFRASFFFLLQSAAQANLGEAYGFGSRTQGLAGSGAAWAFDSYAAYSNPAGLVFSVPEQGQASFSLGVTYMQPQFLPIDQVYVENNYVSDHARMGSVETSYRSTLGETVGVGYRFSEDRRWTIGLASFFPIQQIAFMDTGEAFHPEYVLYRARTQRPQVEVGLGGDLDPSIHFGVGMHLAFSITARASVFLNSDQNKPSIMRFSSSIQPKAAPYFGVLWTPSLNRDEFVLGGVLRLPVASDATMVLQSGARLLGSLAALDFNFTALSALFYDPLTVQLATSWEHRPGWRFYGQLDHAMWSRFTGSPLQIQSPDITSCTENAGNCGFSISPGKNPAPRFQNIWIPRIAEEVSLGDLQIRVGYAYQPSVLSGLPTGAGNDLDPPKHMMTAGFGFLFKRFLSTPFPARVDFNAAYHQLMTQHIEKTPGNEAGTLGDSKIGAPSYNAGGKILGGGVSLSLSL